MQSMKIWIIASTIAEMLSYGVCQTQFQNKNESNFKQEYRINQNNSNVFFGDIFAECMKDFLPFSDVNTNCTRDGQHFVNEFHNQSIWAVKMYDSSAKYPGGILSGEVTELGNFDQCMSVSSERFGIHGAYALVNVQFRLTDNHTVINPADFVRVQLERSKRNMLTAGPENILWAVCVPDSCTADDVRQSAVRVLNPTFQKLKIAVDVLVPSALYSSKSTTLENNIGGLVLTYGIISIGVIMAVAGTLYVLFSEKLITKNDGFIKNCLKSFSIINNMKLLMEDSKNDQFSIISGLRVIGMLGVIIGHRIMLDIAAPTISYEFFNHIYEDFSTGILKSPLIVETFFVISGFLTCIILDSHLRNGKPFGFFKLLANRLVRIFPTYIAVLLIFSNILPYSGDGPMWKYFIYPEAEYCRNNWWTNLLFIQTYVNSYEMCVVHAWYLACDIHFFIVGTLLIYTIYKWKKVGQYIFSILFLLSIYMPAKYIYDNKHWGLIPYYRSTMRRFRHNDFVHSVYVKSHFRITTYLIGIAAAYIYLHIKKSKLKFSVASRVLGFSISFIVSIICFTAMTGYFYLSNVTYNPWDHILYFTFQRIIYALCISYILVVGSLSSFGFISDMFKSKFCLVIARLSYIIYLVHFIVLFQSYGQLRHPMYENYWTIFWEINADTMTTLVYSIIINLIIEAPSRNIFNYIFNNMQKKRKYLNPNGNEKELVQTENPVPASPNL